jgi:hypothetical protein
MPTGRAALPLLALLAACGPAPPAADARGTQVQPFEVSLRAPDLAESLGPGLQPWGGMPLAVKETSNSADVTWRTEVEVGAGQTLTVVPLRGDAVVFSGAPLRADFYHVGRVLLVREGEGEATTLHNFLEPVRWFTARR